jgi:predicted unusual protein kinase regulating ubiquinone biosynthesis (AarF/ABC1/UbiB family)
MLFRVIRRTLRDALRGYRIRRKGTGDGIQTDAEVRRAQLARMGTAVGARMGAARLRTIGRGEDKRREITRDAALRSTADVLDVMGNMKGVVMKLAQMASFVIDGLPDGVQQQLAQLQTAAPPMAYELVSDVVAKELGSPPEKVCAEFDPEPLAAASIGQVHAARTHDGRDVVVKVQYPGVDEAIKSDLQNADMLFQTVAAMFGGFDPRALLEEIVERMTDEFDYTKEARNQQYFADRYHGHRFVKIPDVVPELSAMRVLTSERIRGRGFYAVLDDPQETRNRHGEIISRFAQGSINEGVFSGDPHPGNYIFLDDGRVCFIDFGLVKRLDAHETELLRAPGRAGLNGDESELEATFRALGVIADGVEVDRRRLGDFFSIMLGPVQEDRPFRYTRKLVGDVIRDVALPDSQYRDVQEKLQFPAMLAMWQRYTIGTAAVLGHLEAEANWHRITREHLFGDPPSTEIGKDW